MKKIIFTKKTLSTSILLIFILYFSFACFYSAIPSFKKSDYTDDTKDKIALIKSVEDMIKDELDFSWLPNDFILCPTRLLDNRPNFQEGVLTMLRHTVRVLRDNLTRQRTTDDINPDIGKAFTLLNNDFQQWLFPSFEGRLEKAISNLENFNRDYTTRISGAKYYPRSDNLIQLFEQYISELGNINNKLLANDNNFFTTDNIFYLGIGTNYALYSLLIAIKKDFSNTLEEKKTTALFNETLERLEQSDFSPLIVVGGDRGSMLANHLIQLAGITADVRQKLKSITVMLDKN